MQLRFAIHCEQPRQVNTIKAAGARCQCSAHKVHVTSCEGALIEVAAN